MEPKIFSDPYDIPEQPNEADWLIDKLIPLNGASELAAPPGTGKSHLVASLANTIANQQDNWFGFKANPDAFKERGKVFWISAEIDEPEEGRQIVGNVIDGYMGEYVSPDLRIFHASNRKLFALNEVETKTSRGELVTTYHVEQMPLCDILMQQFQNHPPELVIIDSTTGLISGMSRPDQEAGLAVATAINQWAKAINCPVLTVAHCNEASSSWPLSRRLGYSARAGTAGVPGGYTATFSMTQVDEEDVTSRKQMSVDPAKRNLIALGQSKIRRGAARFDQYHPIIFEKVGGKILLATDDTDLLAKKDDDKNDGSSGSGNKGKSSGSGNSRDSGGGNGSGNGSEKKKSDDEALAEIGYT